MSVLRSLYLFERVVCCFLVFTIACYAYFSLPFRSPGELYLHRIEHAVLLYGVGLILALCVLRLNHIRRRAGISRRDTWQAFQDCYLKKPHLLCDLRALHAISVMFVLFIQLKHLIPYINKRIFDDVLYAQERRWFGQHLVFERLYSFLGNTSATFLSDSYTAFYPYVAGLILCIVLQRDSKLKQEFTTAFVLLWFIGVLIIYVFPSWGPCFYKPEIYNVIRGTEVSDMQDSLWSQKLLLNSSAQGIYLISGFPSLHLAVVVLGSKYLSRLSKMLCLLSSVFALLTIITTLYFGWHYVVDDIGAVFLVLLVIPLARFLESRFDGTKTS